MLSDGLSQGLAEFRKQFESLEVFEGALYSVPMPTFLHAEDGEILFLNHAWIELSGYTLDDIPTMSVWLEKACNQHQALLTPAINRLYELEAILDEGEDYITTKSGAVRTWYFSSAPAGKLPDGRRLVITTAVDLTESDRAKELLWEYTLSQSVLGTITQQMQSTLKLPEVLNIVVTEVRQLFGADRVVVFQSEGNGCQAVVRAESADSNLLSMLDACFEDPWDTDKNYAQGKACITSGPDDSGSSLCQFLKKYQIQAAIAAPVMQDDVRWGTLCICQHFGAPSWRPFLVEFIEQLTVQIAIAIRHSELHHQVQQLNVALEQQVQERTAELQRALDFESLLRQFTSRVRDSLDEAHILRTSAAEIVNQLSLTDCAITKYDATAGTTALCYGPNSAHDDRRCPAHYADYFSNLRFDLAAGEALQFCPTSLGPYGVQHPATILVCPIINQKNTLGHFWLVRPGTTFSPIEISLVEQITDYCSMALHQARLYQASQEQVVKLTELSQVKDDFLSTVSHELRTPLTNIEMAIQLLAIGLEKTQVLAESPQMQRYFQILRSECAREIDLVNDLLDLQRLEAGVKTLQPVTLEINHWLPQLLNSFQERAQAANQTLALDLPETSCTITCDEATFKRIVVELLNNACKYTPAGERITVSVTLEPKTLQLQVANSGVEISKHDLEHIFERFYRGHQQSRWKQRGTGLGLALIKELIDVLSGEIRAASHSNETTFTVRLPLATAPGVGK